MDKIDIEFYSHTIGYYSLLPKGGAKNHE